jgi:cobalamin synthase
MIEPDQAHVPEGSGQSVRALVRDSLLDVALSVATLTLWPIVNEDRQGDVERRARAMALIPIPAFALGVVLALIDHALTDLAQPLARSAIVIGFALIATKGMFPVGFARVIGELRWRGRPTSTGLTEVEPLGALGAILLIAGEIAVLTMLHRPPARARALVLATMLSRWAIVPAAIGLVPLERWGLGVQWQGGIKFRDFAVSSVIALAVALGLYQVVALVAIVALAVTILLLRLLFSRRFGGVAGFALAAAGASVELVTFAVLAAIAP